jgi:hypothetical protein
VQPYRKAEISAHHAIAAPIETGRGTEAWRGDEGLGAPLAHAPDVDSGEGKAECASSPLPAPMTPLHALFFNPLVSPNFQTFADCYLQLKSGSTSVDVLMFPLLI